MKHHDRQVANMKSKSPIQEQRIRDSEARESEDEELALSAG